MSKLEDELEFQFKAYGLTPEREYRAFTDRRWRFDFAFVNERLAVEVEGGIWTGGRHVRGAGFIADLDKYNRAMLEGWRVARFSGQHVRDGRAIQTILAALK